MKAYLSLCLTQRYKGDLRERKKRRQTNLRIASILIEFNLKILFPINDFNFPVFENSVPRFPQTLPLARKNPKTSRSQKLNLRMLKSAQARTNQKINKLQSGSIASCFIGIASLTLPISASAQTSFSPIDQVIEREYSLHEDFSFSSQNPTSSDPELGTLRLEELDIIPTEIEQPPTVYLIGQISYLQSDNILLSARDPINDGLFRVGASVLAVPELSDRTSFFASVGGSLARYNELTNFDYNQITVNTGIRQRLFAETYGLVGWSHQQLFTKRGSNRFLDEHSLYGEINRRDFLSSQVVLDTFYQSRISFADPDERSQFLNTAGISLGYAPTPQFQAFLDYQFLYADFTRQSRYDLYHQLTGRLVYRPSRNVRVELFSGQSFGHSSSENIDFNGFVFGVNLGVNVPLF